MMTRKLQLLLLAAMLVALLGDRAFAQTAPQLKSAVSRRLHNGIAYDVPLPLTGATAIEGRQLIGGVTLVLTFDQPIASANVAVTAGVADVIGAPTPSGSALYVNLANVANAQSLTIGATNVAGTGGGAVGSGSVSLRVLEGDVNGNGIITASDVNLVKYNVGKPVDGGNYRADVNANGSVTASDVNIVKYRVGTSVAGGPMPNTAPTLSAIGAQATTTGVATSAIPFTVGDAESDPAALSVKATSDNQTLLPDAGITLGGSGGNRTITLAPAAGQNGTANVTLSVSDGLATTTGTFALSVTPSVGNGTATLFLATLRPESGVVSSASGSAVLQLSADHSYATLRFSYSNLTSPRTGQHVHGPADPGQNAGILLDIDSASPQADGSYKWVFVQSGNTSAADQVAAMQAGRLYLNIHTTQYPGGEIRGQFAAAQGSQTFTPPPAPPSLPGGLPTQIDAARFLRQATFGATTDQIAVVQQGGYDAWLNDQFSKPQTSMYQVLTNWKNGGSNIYKDQLWSSWWYLGINAPDQLRQRVTFSLSEILVVSANTATLDAQLFGMARYYDTLGNDAFGNFRTLLQDMTLNPAMGLFLNMQGNLKANPATGTVPNENYAREIMQLFSIGLNQLQPDGTLKLDQNGLPIATYDQSVVQGMARVLTGWDFHQAGQSDYPPADLDNPMTLIDARHEPGTKAILDGVVIPANQGGAADLQQAIDTIFNHPNVGPFISRQLIQKLVCSNPSPAYVYRVAQVFNNNGQGVRGDMKAVIRAILVDYEARSSTMLSQQGFGKLNEPLLRTQQVMRAFHAYDSSGQDRWYIDLTDEFLAQTPMYAASVFNFYMPGFIQPGALAQAGMVAPEFQITTETSTMSVANWLRYGIYGGFRYGNIKLNLAAEQAMAGDAAALVDHVALLLCAGNLNPTVRQIIINQVNAVGDAPTRALTAVHLVSISPDATVQK